MREETEGFARERGGSSMGEEPSQLVFLNQWSSNRLLSAAISLYNRTFVDGCWEGDETGE